MSADREMLEFAAKAGEYVVKWTDQYDCGLTDTYLVPLPLAAQHFRFTTYPYVKWEPLRDDGDALRLAVKLGLFVDAYAPATTVGNVICPTSLACKTRMEDHNGDAYAATRRAIVRAAAEIGKAMP
jgi:hypothetical protein